ncbi:MAG: LD-carboxypeptidase [Cytophagales bacterium]|nr:LD-carboxypeptidase [Cytophagales bacterium]
MITPPYLQPGDKIALISTARKVSEAEMAPAIQLLESWQLHVHIGKHLYEGHHQFAGTPGMRAMDLQSAIDDPDIKAIICTRGGYGTANILDNINFEPLKIHPKWIVGFSDVTALHMHVNALGVSSIHAIMPILFAQNNAQKSINSLKNALFGNYQSISFDAHKQNINAKNSTGMLIGGNLSVLHTIIGTSSDMDYSGKILLIEDIDEYLYHIHRMMHHLKRARKLENLEGLLVGHFTNMKDNTVPFGSNAFEIISECVAEYGYPVYFGFPAGHEFDNMAIYMGQKCTIDNTGTNISLNFA